MAIGERLRVVLAIAAKDITDAVRNRTILGSLFSVLFLIVFYQILPSLDTGGALPRLALYDAGDSRLVAELENSAELDLLVMDSAEDVLWYVGDRELVLLGLTLPADLDQRLEADEDVELEGYIVHWASDSAAAETREFFEDQLSQLTGQPVIIHTEGNTVYTRPDSHGMAFVQSIMLVIATMMMGLILTPTLMLEEKLTKTMDALLVSPASAGQLVIGKALAGLFFCAAGLGVAFAFNATLITQWWLAILVAACGSMMAVAFGLLMGSILETRQQATVLVWILFVVAIMPVGLDLIGDILPKTAMSIIRWVPSTVLARAYRTSFADRVPSGQILPELAVLIGCTGILLAVVAWVVRRSDR